ncbi:hypothetical protein E2P81_ATG04134 [Venturia nashicola]|uniref:Uncharacterized protein n=1 Tax=Venturia nashicola TaxID=86259 RepID=A0A4Z1PA26_9PEZI|nr:hypothetical protein E6O75_ATG04233 [Venturia nashicola]TLD37322.1 hypothetical protein E2P81_ATG04134 [Venturia nashicola]
MQYCKHQYIGLYLGFRKIMSATTPAERSRSKPQSFSIRLGVVPVSTIGSFTQMSGRLGGRVHFVGNEDDINLLRECSRPFIQEWERYVSIKFKLDCTWKSSDSRTQLNSDGRVFKLIDRLLWDSASVMHYLIPDNISLHKFRAKEGFEGFLTFIRDAEILSNKDKATITHACPKSIGGNLKHFVLAAGPFESYQVV